ncbi:MAG: Panacea domain-containing protein [Alphaproteobacteria bacterium]
MTISATAAAKKICELGDWQVTNLQLQKILYLAHMVFLGNNNGKPLIGSSFEAWDYGPVVPELYHDAKKYGSKPIRMGFHSLQNISGTPEEAEIERACSSLLAKSASRLVDFTHRPGGAWDKNYVPGARGVIIPNQDILDEYRKLSSDR